MPEPTMFTVLPRIIITYEVVDLDGPGSIWFSSPSQGDSYWAMRLANEGTDLTKLHTKVRKMKQDASR